jgi:hypothetical protein
MTRVAKAGRDATRAQPVQHGDPGRTGRRHVEQCAGGCAKCWGSATSARSSSLDGEGGNGGEGGGATGDEASESDSPPAAGTPLQNKRRSDHPRKTPAKNVKAQLAKYGALSKSGTTAASAIMVAAAAAPAVSPAGVKLQSRLGARCWCNTATNTANCYWLLICTAAW